MRSNSWIVLGSLVFFSAIICFGAEIYVSPTGNDGAAGTLAAPLATVAAARDKADQLKAGNTPVTVYLRGGTYYLTAPVVFGPANSGTIAAPIVYTAYGAEKPVVSGGIKLPDTLTWAVSSGQIKVTTIAPNLKIDQLFLNGKRQLLARFPNFDSTKILDGYDANCMSTARVATWKTPAEGPGYVRALHQNLWGSNSFTITGKNADNTLGLQWSGDNNNGNGMHPTYRMVENIFEELDAPGEWYYRKTTGQLYFYPPAGTNLSTAKIEFASQDELIRVVGTATAKVSYLQFNGLTFTHTYRTLFSKPYVSLLQGDWTIARAGAIYIDNCENLRVENCFFDQVGGNGVFISGYNRHHVIFNNTFVDGGATCVAICGLMTAVRCPRMIGSCTDKIPGPLTNDYPAYITVDNNTMVHFGRFEKQPAGVNISMSQCDTVRHNTIHDCPRAGINFTDGCWGGHEIAYNWVYRAVLETGDHGPFNAWGRDRNFNWGGSGNDSSMTKLDAMYTTNIHNNRFESAPPLFGIDLDDGSSNYNVYNNLCIGVGLKLWHTRQNRYVNNIVVRGGVTEFHDTYPMSGHYYAHNITMDTCVYSFCCFADMSSGAIPGEVKSRIKMVDSNCIYSGPPDTRKPKMVQWGQRNTVTTNWATWLAAGLDAHSALADPLFTDTNKTWPNYAPKGDFTVQTGSPALGLGFKNFPMDSFGVMQVPSVAVQNPFVARGVDGSGAGRFAVRYSAGRLIVSNDGDYQVTITTALGRTVKVFYGKGDSDFNVNAKIMSAGIYFAVVRAKNGVETKRFIIN
jgi:hypothetical protein